MIKLAGCDLLIQGVLFVYCISNFCFVFIFLFKGLSALSVSSFFVNCLHQGLWYVLANDLAISF
jgi:hypothetical protein